MAGDVSVRSAHGWIDRRAALAFTVAITATLLGCATASARPTLVVPDEATQGARLVITVEPRGAGRCALVTIGPSGSQRVTRLTRRPRRDFALHLGVRKNASRGSWDLRLQCRERVSVAKTVRVIGRRKGAGGRLFATRRIVSFSRRAPRGFNPPARDQDGPGAPSIPNVELDGLGSVAGDRGRGALEWALRQQGRRDYDFWCLKFVAHAFGANAAGYGTAQQAANALRPRDRGLPASAAPPGALLFFHYRGRDGVNYGHVGISLGDGRMVHAVSTVRIERVDGVRHWRSTYLGWAFAPARWPGRPASPAPQAPASTPSTPSVPAGSPSPSPIVKPPAAGAPRRVISVDNRVTNGAGMREDPTPLRMTTKPWVRCGSRGCNINGTERGTGGTYDAAVCQTTGERTTNGNDSDPVDDGNPLRFESARYYGVRLANGTFGYVSEVWIRAADRGGLGLPGC